MIKMIKNDIIIQNILSNFKITISYSYSIKIKDKKKLAQIKNKQIDLNTNYFWVFKTFIILYFFLIYLFHTALLDPL